MQITDKLKELSATLAFDYLDEKAAIARLALAFFNETADKHDSFAASCELMNFGPDNDWNGLRSAATRIRTEWETRIMNPALKLKKMKFNKGTIYKLSTGYCMQETRFYQVVGFTKSGKSALVRPLKRYESGEPGFVTTGKDCFAGPVRTIRITLDSEGSEQVRVGYQDYLWANRPWNGKAGSRDYSINFENQA